MSKTARLQRTLILYLVVPLFALAAAATALAAGNVAPVADAQQAAPSTAGPAG